VRRAAPWIIASLVIALVAFGVGRCTGGEEETPDHAREGADEATIWTCAMHPQVRQPEPGQCPICGMDLIPVSSDQSSQPSPRRVTLGERAKILARVRTTPARRLPSTGATLRLLGRVDVDETTLEAITAWTGGRIDRLHVRVTGERIRRGQTVATIYSPEVYAAQQDLVTARRQIERLAGGSELARTASEATLSAARQRLRLLGIPEAEVERMETASSPSRQVAIRSPFAGTVIERLATEGAYVQTGTALYRVADLARLWVQLDAYESDLPHLTVGQAVELEVQGTGGDAREGRVAFVDPVVDPQRRTARVRVEVGNADGRLRPGMFVEAVLRAPADGGAAQPLVIPASAPLFTGRRSVVYVEVPDATSPTYDARTVRLGPRVGDVYPVVAGLREGERVVVEGAFAIDADLQIRGGQSMMMGDDDSAAGGLALEGVTPELRAGLRSIVEPYLALQRALAADDLTASRAAAARVRDATDAFSPTEPAPFARAYRPIAQHLRMHGGQAADATTLEALRGQFEPLSAMIAHLLRRFGNPMDEPLRLAHCPMAFDRGAEWVQSDETIDNSYFGPSMRTCGSIRETVEPGELLPDDPQAPPPALETAPPPNEGAGSAREAGTPGRSSWARPRPAPSTAPSSTGPSTGPSTVRPAASPRAGVGHSAHAGHGATP
jgi:Cu(I)/Ag(I) efflux system membrane fusion protein